MKRFMLIVSLISAVVLISVPDIVEAADERTYIKPVFTENSNGPTIGTTVKSAIEVNGKYYRDSNGNGELDPFENWELDTDTRVKDLVSRMTADQKLGMLTIGDRSPGASLDIDSLDGLLDEYTGEISNMFGTYQVVGTTKAIGELGMRHFIFRQSPTPANIARWNNAMQQVAESTDNGIPVVIVSNSRNENAEMIFGMNDASGIFSTWPGTLGLAAAALGDIKAGGNAQLITDFAEIARTEWDASGLRKGYMYMVDVVTDPRWQRGYGTFGERTDFVTDAITRIIKGFQGSSEGVQSNGVALTIKHFPGGGARENGFDPHYFLGRRNVYPTEGSLEKYHLPPFKAAVDNNASSIMPYYAKPYPEKSKTQTYNGREIDLSEEVGFAFNKAIITDFLRGTLGFKGYINSDTGILGNMAWGVEDLDRATQAAYAINAGTDAISGLTDVTVLLEMYEKGLLSDERLDEAAGRLLKEEFLLGLFENPYRDPDNAEAAVVKARADERVYKAHQKSVVLLKNTNKTLPLTSAKLSGKKVYAEFFNKSGNTSDATSALRASLTERGMTVTDDYTEADYAILFIDPSSGNYSSATEGYLELDICESKDVVKVDPETGKPTSETCKETTLKDADKIALIAIAVHLNGGSVIANVNIKLPWLMGNVEPYADALTAGFDTVTDATIDVITGVYSPTGVLPVTLPRNDAVIFVDDNGDCISPNDVAGYDKDKYLPSELLDSNGKGYAYKDSAGNYYESLFGLSISSSDESTKPGSSSGGCDTGLSIMGLFAMAGLCVNFMKKR
ncbi:MAG: glycoside hydrolase family 3 C-terminal domain-containing protein [Synergistaceae bacterium]|nr:glycoside hydrolase family 3 C-terminal domain-containing protein [Synergistaceae bacterium]